MSGKNLPPDTPVEIATLSDVLFTERQNDVAFIVGGRIVIFIEHQSSLNENMPLRLLIYAARVYEKIINNDDIYKKKLIKLPKPDFIVLYNGVEPFEDEKTLRLSDAFMEAPGELAEAGLGGSLELTVRVVNINEGRNEDIVRKCETLNGYVIFIGKIRSYLKADMNLTEAVTAAVKDCIRENILADFLKSNSSEVINMLTMEFDIDRARVVWMQEAKEEGFEEGRQEGHQVGLQVGHQEGRQEGLQEGQQEDMQIVTALIARRDPIEIAKTLRLPVDRIIQWKNLLDQNVE
jgi:hypothetical protein